MIMRLLLPAFALCAAVVSAHAIQTDNHGLHAVPVPKGTEMKIDGDLAKWDLSGQMLITYDLESLKDVYSAQVAAMYDAENFYLAIHWKDATPMGNSHDPRYQANRGWAGDAVQLRFKTDRIAHLTAWYYAEKKEPALQIDYGTDLEKPFGGGNVQLFQVDGAKMQQGVEMAFKADADGKGYVQEIKIPWKLITKDKKFAAGDQFSMGIELLWGEADWPVHRYADNLAEGATSREFFWTAHKSWGPVILEPKGDLKLPEPDYLVALRKAQQGESATGPVDIEYTIPKDGRVTIAIEDPNGQRIRNLVPALPRKAGKNVEKWDGLNDKGKPVPPGEYVYKGLVHDGIRANYALSFANPGNPSWATDDNRGAFYGDHTAPQAAAAAGKFVALATPMGEAGKHLIGLDLAGQRLWGLPNRVAFDGGRISLATDGQTLWVATEGKQTLIYQVNIATGRYQPWEVMGKDKDGNDFKILDLVVSELPGMGADKAAGANLTGIAYHDGSLALALQRENVVKLLDPQKGTVLSQISVEKPQSVAFTPEGKLLILSGGRILAADAKGGTTPLGKEAYPEAYSLAVAPSGDILVSVRGSDQNVKVLSPEGKFVREIGERGGRPNFGPFNKNAMRLPAQIAVDSQNRLWVTEETQNPKRTSLWDVATGKLVQDFNGTTHYCAAGSINPFDPTMGFSDDTVYRIDWDKGTFEPIYSLGKREEPNDLFPPSVHNLTSRIMQKDGRLYVFTTDSAQGSREVQATMFDGKNWRSVAHTGIVNLKRATGAAAIYKHPFFAGHDEELYVWTDQNGDGLVQAEELTFTKPQIDGKPANLRSYYWGQLPGDDGTITYLAPEQNALVQFPIAGFTKDGAPKYDIQNPRIVKLDQPVLGKGNGEGQLIGGSNGVVYINQDPLIAVAPDGKVMGGYPNPFTSVHGSHKAKAARPGYLIGPSSFLGVIQVGNAEKGGAGEIFALNGNLGENYLFTADGLFIQSLFKDTRGFFESPAQAVRGMSLDAITAGGESFGGNLTRTRDGKTYLTNGGTDARVIELTGFDSIQRFNGKIDYTQAEWEEAQKLLAQKAAESLEAKDYLVKKGSAAVDGKLEDWPELVDETKPAIVIEDNPQKQFARVQARYDDQNLYLAYLVKSSRSEMKNAGQDERLLFKSGDVVDLMIGLETDQGATGKRVLMTIKDKQPIAVLNQKKAPGAAASEKFDFSSPWRTITFDRVVVVPEVRILTAPAKGGYLVEAAIPWKTLGITPKPGLVLKADVGALFGDQGGTQTVSRQYWSNQSTGLVNDVPGEADLAPQLWGTFKLE